MDWARPSMPCTASVGSPATSSIKGVSWPVDRASLVALSDLGLSPYQIARYFSVTLTEVNRLLEADHSDRSCPRLTPATTPLATLTHLSHPYPPRFLTS